jgi:nucleotide-binding universal stress UspA family protein
MEAVMWEPKVILNARSFTESSAEAYEIACDLARKHEARLIFLHVTPSPIASYIKDASELPPGDLEAHLFKVLRQPRVAEADIRVEHQVLEGDPVSAILRAARESQCDLIILGHDGSSGFSRLFKRDIVQEIIRDAPCSVLVGRLSSDAADPASSGTGETVAAP